MSQEILIDIEPFKTEITSIETVKEGIPETFCSIDSEGLELDSVTQLQTLVETLDSLYVDYRNHLAQDVKNLNVILANWMKVDADNAGKNYLEVVTGK